ncbi:MAG: hypothetical protein WED34_09565 [Planctomycetales bacterium]
MADLFQVRSRFFRSAHLERDFQDPDAIKGYMLTPTAKASLDRLAAGLAPRSTQRSWRITGDYGTGKSSFALALSHLFAGDNTGLPKELRRSIDFRALGVERPSLLPVLVTGSRSHLATAILGALRHALEEAWPRGRPPQILERVRAAARITDQQSEDRAISLLTEAASYLRENGKAAGLLIVLDEMGKFLEYAALHPERQDVYFLQSLAEVAARSRETPIVLVGLLHQGFQAYADLLTQPAQKEWEKVAGRFEEILFDQPLEQASALVASALNVRQSKLPSGVARELVRDMGRALGLGWFGPSAGREALTDLAPGLYPLHPTVLPVLARLFSRFGQNERSLYSFLLSDEPHALQAFARQPALRGRFYRIHHLYDYARAAFGHRLAVQSYRSHWNQIESVVESFPRDDEMALDVLKTVAILNLIDSPDHLAVDDSVALAVSGGDTGASTRIKPTLRDLQRGKTVLYFRGRSGGYCLWPHTSVNLEKAYQEAFRTVPEPTRVAADIRSDLETRPLVARRHYIETGNLRHFAVKYAAPGDLHALLERGPQGADGLILVALCETPEECEAATAFAESDALRGCNQVLIAVPQPLRGLASLLTEVQRWEWVGRNIPELAHDAFAQEEVSRQLAAARQVLENRVRTYIGIRQFGEKTDLQWFYRGKSTHIRGGRELLELLSDVCDDVFGEAPQIRNELVNRHILSSAATAARLRLIEQILASPGEPLLGMDPAKKPPEKSMYLSVLKAAGLHREEGGIWRIDAPPQGKDPANIRPVLGRILEILEARRGGRIKVTEVFAEMRKSPFGLRDGLAPLLLAVFVAIHERDVAFYENGRFLSEVTAYEFQRLIKVPDSFEVQYCKIGGMRAVVFEKLFRALNPGKERKDIDLLDVVRPLIIFASELPQYAQRTAAVSSAAAAVRAAVESAEEPASLLFRQLPQALGLEPFESEDEPGPARVKRFVERLRTSLDELGNLYPELVRRMLVDIHRVFERPGGADEARAELAGAAERALVSVAEPRLKALCLRLADRALPEREWVESVGSLVCSKPPAKWLDGDVTIFRDELARLARQFRRVESTLFAGAGAVVGDAMRVAITSRDGTEVEQVVYVDAAEQAKVAELEAHVTYLLNDEGRLGVVAATRAIWRRLQRPE